MKRILWPQKSQHPFKSSHCSCRRLTRCRWFHTVARCWAREGGRVKEVRTACRKSPVSSGKLWKYTKTGLVHHYCSQRLTNVLLCSNNVHASLLLHVGAVWCTVGTLNRQTFVSVSRLTRDQPQSWKRRNASGRSFK